jgi:medium-chain acyl-[acyl-carrier-protein] hydrolase
MDDRAMFEALRKLGGIPDELFESQALIAFSAPPVRADMKLFETYEPPAHPLHGVPIHAYYGRNDARVGDSYLAWGEQTDAFFGCRAFDGGHMFLDDASEALAEALAADLDRREPRALSA